MQSLVGTTAPDFSALTSEGEEFNLNDLDGRWKSCSFTPKTVLQRAREDAYRSRSSTTFSNPLNHRQKSSELVKILLKNIRNSKKIWGYHSYYFQILKERLLRATEYQYI